MLAKLTSAVNLVVDRASSGIVEYLRGEVDMTESYAKRCDVHFIFYILYFFGRADLD